MRFKSLLLAIAMTLTPWVVPPMVHANNGSFDQGVRFYGSKQWHEALVQFEAAYTMGYEPANCLYYAALCHQQLGDFSTAKDVYHEIVTKYGTTPAASNARTALETLKNYQPPKPASQAAAPATKDGLAGVVSFAESYEGMIVPVTIQGKLAPCIWDSGATTVFYMKSQLDKAGVDTSKATKSGRAIGIGGEIQTYKLDVLVTVGNVAKPMPIYFQDDTAQVRDARGQQSERYGLLGEDFFSHFVYEVDPNNHQIRFLRPCKSASRYAPPTVHRGTGDDVPFVWEDGVMVVTPKINGRECDMIFDTGASAVAFSDKQFTAAGMTRPVDSRSAIASGVGGQRSAFAFKLNSVSLGPVKRDNIQANISVFGTQGRPLLGQNFLRGVRYQVDPEKCVMRFTVDK